MKMKRIASLLLCFVLAFTMVFPLFTATVSAEGLGDKKKYEELKAISYTTQVYASPEEKLETMTLVVENEGYALYIQEYTAEVCVVDKATGQMLFTNPYDVADNEASNAIKYELLSQIKLSYKSTKGESSSLDSFSDAAMAEQIAIKLIRGGVRVEYTIGEAIKKRVVPYQIEKSRFEEDILRPFYEAMRFRAFF